VDSKSDVLVRWAQLIAGSAGVGPLPLRLCLACARLAGADGGAVTLAYTRTERVTLCVTDEAAGQLEDLQDVLGQGPGPDAYRTGRTASTLLGSPDDRRWPVFRQSAQAAVGSAAVYAFPIQPEGAPLGVLTLYQLEPRPLRYALAELGFLADALGVALLRDPGSRAEAGLSPWSSRARVHQATGMVVAQLGIAPDDALAVLRAHAYADATPLDGIAARVTSRQLDFSTADPGTACNEDETP
jgi:hypothetical protein